MSAIETLIVTGATGYLGSQIINGLDLSKYEKLYFIDRTLKEDRLNKDVLKNAKIEFVPADLSAPEVQKILAKKFKDLENVTFLHASYLGDAEKSFLGSLSQDLFMIYLSSAAVYGEANEGKALVETDEPEPLNDYGRIKLESEKIIQDKFKKSLILRISNPFANEPDKRGVVRIFGDDLFHDKKISINQDDESSEILRDFIYIEDLVAGIRSLMNNNCDGLFNLSSGKSTSLTELIKVIATRFSKEPEIEYLGTKADEIQKSCLSAEKLLKETELNEIRSIKDFSEKLKIES